MEVERVLRQRVAETELKTREAIREDLRNSGLGRDHPRVRATEEQIKDLREMLRRLEEESAGEEVEEKDKPGSTEAEPASEVTPVEPANDGGDAAGAAVPPPLEKRLFALAMAARREHMDAQSGASDEVAAGGSGARKVAFRNTAMHPSAMPLVRLPPLDYRNESMEVVPTDPAKLRPPVELQAAGSLKLRIEDLEHRLARFRQQGVGEDHPSLQGLRDRLEELQREAAGAE
jgi:hypothetical protein